MKLRLHIPLECDMAFLYALHIEADGRYRTGASHQQANRFLSPYPGEWAEPWSHVLNRELATLCITALDLKRFPIGQRDGSLTASTLSSDVLPAFWSPIMVMSISVALGRAISNETLHLGYVNELLDEAHEERRDRCLV